METCGQHGKLTDAVNTILTNQAVMQKDIEYLRRDTETVLLRFGLHVQEAEKQGGRHERLKNAEDTLIALEEKIKEDKKTLELRMLSDKKSLEDQMRNDRIMGRWFMIGSGLVSGGVVAGVIKIWAVLTKILGI